MIEATRLRLQVSDVQRSLRFYIERLGVKLVSGHGDGAPCLDLGAGFLVALTPSAAPAPLQLELWVRGEYEQALQIYENRGLRIEREDAARALLRDPDGHQLWLVRAPS